MVDVSGKETTARTAVAKGCVHLNAKAFHAAVTGSAAKGDVLGTARIAGIMAAKKTADLIPMCHPLALETCAVDFEAFPGELKIEAACSVKTSGKTGAEMEALTGVTAALLTVYDMCKAVDRGMVINHVRLCEKSGGKSGRFKRDEKENRV